MSFGVVILNENIDKRIAYLEFTNRENDFHHHRYDTEMLQYEYHRACHNKTYGGGEKYAEIL